MPQLNSTNQRNNAISFGKRDFLPLTYSTWTENIKLGLQCLEKIIKINERQKVYFFPQNFESELAHIISQILEISEFCWNHLLVEKFPLTKETFITTDDIWVLKRQESLLLIYLEWKFEHESRAC